MSNKFHKDFVGFDNHALPAATYADITARDADSAFQVLGNVDKMVRIDAPAMFFVLHSISPSVWIEATNTGNTTFIGNSDTPGTFSGQAGKPAHVNTGETAMEFVDPNLVGTEFEKFESLGQSNTLLGTLQSKIDATTASKPAGVYRIGFFCDLANNTGNKTTLVEFSVDGSVINPHDDGVDGFEIGPDGADSWESVASVQYKTLGAPATIDVDIDFSIGTGGTARISNAVIEIWRIS